MLNLNKEPSLAAPYVKPLSDFLLVRLKGEFKSGMPLVVPGAGLSDFGSWTSSDAGIRAPFRGSVADLSHAPHFFSQAVKPISRALAAACAELTEAFTDLNCAALYQTLRRTELGPLSGEELAPVRAIPAIRPENGLLEWREDEISIPRFRSRINRASFFNNAGHGAGTSRSTGGVGGSQVRQADLDSAPNRRRTPGSSGSLG